jgi:Fic family protein
LLIALILHQEQVLRQPLLYLSLYFKEHRAEYYRQLDAIRHTGDWEGWLVLFLEGVEQTAAGAVDTAHRLLALFERDALRVRDLGRSAATALQVFQALRMRPVANIRFLSEQAGVSFATAARHVDTLVKLDILRELTGRSRERVFAYQAYLDILNEGAEPL